MQTEGDIREYLALLKLSASKYQAQAERAYARGILHDYDAYMNAVKAIDIRIETIKWVLQEAQ